MWKVLQRPLTVENGLRLSGVDSVHRPPTSYRPITARRSVFSTMINLIMMPIYIYDLYRSFNNNGEWAPQVARRTTCASSTLTGYFYQPTGRTYCQYSSIVSRYISRTLLPCSLMNIVTISCAVTMQWVLDARQQSGFRPWLKQYVCDVFSHWKVKKLQSYSSHDTVFSIPMRIYPRRASYRRHLGRGNPLFSSRERRLRRVGGWRIWDTIRDIPEISSQMKPNGMQLDAHAGTIVSAMCIIIVRFTPWCVEILICKVGGSWKAIDVEQQTDL